jgi:YD repeat-containing protein
VNWCAGCALAAACAFGASAQNVAPTVAIKEQQGQVCHSYTAAAVAACRLTYDAASRITAITDEASPAASTSYGYDELDRLTNVATPASAQVYDYDAVGNGKQRRTTAPSPPIPMQARATG